MLPLSFEADYCQTKKMENGTVVSNNALCEHPNIVSSNLSSDVFSVRVLLLLKINMETPCLRVV